MNTTKKKSAGADTKFSQIMPDDTPPKPFGGASALRPSPYGFTDARAPANNNWPRPANDDVAQIDIRQDMEERLMLPRWLLDWFTGKPILDGKSKPTELDPIAYLLLDIGIALLGVIGIVAVMAYFPLLLQIVLVPVGWLMIVGRLRKMQTLEGHEASHGNFFLQTDPRRRSKRRILGMSVNDFFGEIATTFALSQNMVSYRSSHNRHHDEATYTTDKDPDALLVRSIRKNYGWHLVDPAEYPAGLQPPPSLKPPRCVADAAHHGRDMGCYPARPDRGHASVNLDCGDLRAMGDPVPTVCASADSLPARMATAARSQHSRVRRTHLGPIQRHQAAKARSDWHAMDQGLDVVLGRNRAD